mmetsp:Transcript_21810/g.65153  ORF Transcript_21810/g.65153 Transcript_21810/m.65153 type:complete len:477 (+) Transcript_21810:928-2358(+)
MCCSPECTKALGRRRSLMRWSPRPRSSSAGAGGVARLLLVHKPAEGGEAMDGLEVLVETEPGIEEEEGPGTTAEAQERLRQAVPPRTLLALQLNPDCQMEAVGVVVRQADVVKAAIEAVVATQTERRGLGRRAGCSGAPVARGRATPARPHLQVGPAGFGKQSRGGGARRLDREDFGRGGVSDEGLSLRPYGRASDVAARRSRVATMGDLGTVVPGSALLDTRITRGNVVEVRRFGGSGGELRGSLAKSAETAMAQQRAQKVDAGNGKGIQETRFHRRLDGTRGGGFHSPPVFTGESKRGAPMVDRLVPTQRRPRVGQVQGSWDRGHGRSAPAGSVVLQPRLQKVFSPVLYAQADAQVSARMGQRQASGVQSGHHGRKAVRAQNHGVSSTHVGNDGSAGRSANIALHGRGSRLGSARGGTAGGVCAARTAAADRSRPRICHGVGQGRVVTATEAATVGLDHGQRPIARVARSRSGE